MRKPLLLTLSIGFISIVLSCSDSLDEVVSLEQFVQPVTENESHFVSLQDIQTLTNTQTLQTKSSVCTESEIICYEDAQDTLLFICCKPSGGWTIYSSDTRVPAIVAEADTGSFAEVMKCTPKMAWIETIAQDMKAIRNSTDEQLNFTKEEITSNKEFWESIKQTDEYVKSHVKDYKQNVKRRIPPLDSIEYDFSKMGHYEIRYTNTYSQVYDSIEHLITTMWNQGQPYNYYCPMTTLGNGTKAPAGCVPVAIAQLFYYLHNHIGVPLTAPSAAYCNGDVNSYSSGQGTYTISVWNTITAGNNMAPLIANIGKLSNIQYGNIESMVSENDVTNAFPAYGINCTYTYYNETNLKNSLLDSIPVILSAKSSNAQYGHFFIADRFLRKRYYTLTVYKWVYDYYPTNPDGSLIPVPLFPDIEEYTYYSPYINMIGMNWGWSNCNPNEWYTLTGDWVINNTNYNQNRKMIYNFSAAN